MSLFDYMIACNRMMVVNIAQDFLDGRIGVIQASRQLSALRFAIAGDESDPDFLTFVGIESETEDLPVDQARQQWSPDALAAKDAEIVRCEALYREAAREAASHLVARFA
jgi:hypothetical protein